MSSEVELDVSSEDEERFRGKVVKQEQEPAQEAGSGRKR
jgi:hypothetical protein